MPGYEKSRSAFESLESSAPLEDWVEIDAEMRNFMENPTKDFAAGLWQAAIGLWFQEHGVDPTDNTQVLIAERYGNGWRLNKIG